MSLKNFGLGHVTARTEPLKKIATKIVPIRTLLRKGDAAR